MRRAVVTRAGCLLPHDGVLGTWHPSMWVHQQLLLSSVLILETLKCFGLLVRLLVAKHISLVYLFPRGSLLLIVPAPISFPILINLCQVKPQITCQIADWISPAFPWAFTKKGYHLAWVHYQSGLGCQAVCSVFFCHCQREKSDLTAQVRTRFLLSYR